MRVLREILLANLHAGVDELVAYFSSPDGERSEEQGDIESPFRLDRAVKSQFPDRREARSLNIRSEGLFDAAVERAVGPRHRVPVRLHADVGRTDGLRLDAREDARVHKLRLALRAPRAEVPTRDEMVSLA